MTPAGWRTYTLGDLSDPTAPIRYGVVQVGSFTPGGVPIVPIKQIGRIGRAHLHLASRDIEEPYANSRIRGGDVLLSVKGTIGEVGLVPDGFHGNIAREIARIRPNEKVEGRFLASLLSAPETQRRIDPLVVGTTRREFSIAAVRAFEVLLPPIPEQRRIAEILSTWDRAIETVEALIANTREQKAALMQSLLTGKCRLPGFDAEWSATTIGAVCDQVTERADDAVHLPVLACSKRDGFVESLKYFKKKVFSDDLSAYKVVRRGMVAFPTNHVEEGSIARQDIVDAGLVSPIYCVFAPTAVDGQFLIRLLKTDTFTQRFAAATNASVDRRGSLRWKEFAKLALDLPSLDEQRAIATVIDRAEDKERLLAAQRDALREEKAALMQQLLTGKRRVLSAESEAA